MSFNLKPDHKAVKAYYSELANLTGNLHASTEGSVAPLFADLLNHCAKQMGRTLIEQFPIKRAGQNLRVDGAIVDSFKLLHGLWEAKDSADDLGKEIQKKVEKGYPRDNILFQAPQRAVLFQDGQLVLDADLTKPDKLIDILKLFFEYEPPAFEQWNQAVEEFKLKVPELGEALLGLIEDQRKSNPTFVRAFDDFTTLVRDSINPNISTQALEEMLIQHLLTERIFRKIFDNPDFSNRNVIAREIEKVIQALTSRSFSRDQFLGSLDRFYGAIETTAATISDYSEKQAFLNTVYEKFFQGFSVKAADIYGIVYTPQPIVNFMVNSVEHILQEEFGRSLSDENVHIIDPFVGTGNFIVNVMRKIKKTSLPYKYANELHCNEVMLLPYYIASMNIEHAYMDLTGAYAPFEGICLVDTFDINEQMTIFGHENTERIARQRNAPIFVVIANPPYNAKQVNENDNNKKRVYRTLDKRVAETYVRDSKAQNNNALSDSYVKAIKWASDRIKEEGVVAYITNNGFLDGYAFDGMRKHLEKDFSKIVHINLKGNARTSGVRRQKEAGNVFDDAIRVGVGISFFIRKADVKQRTEILYYEVDDYLRSIEKQDYLVNGSWYGGLPDCRILEPDSKHTWLTDGIHNNFGNYLELGSRENQRNKKTIFSNYCRGIETTRDAWLYNWNTCDLEKHIQHFLDFYNSETERWKNRESNQITINDFVNLDDKKAKWSSDLLNSVLLGKRILYKKNNFYQTLYRPFNKVYLYLEKDLIHRPAIWAELFSDSKIVNRTISLKGLGNSQPFFTIMTENIPDVQLTPNGQAFSYFEVSDGGSDVHENITDWALKEFQEHYSDPSITKWDIFYYVYGLLHSNGYRSKYAANLRRELPRIPFAPNFRAFSAAGKQLADLHVNYESQPEYPLGMQETPGKPLNWRVEKMKLSADKTAVIYNDFLTLSGIPLQVYDYKLGNRSALEWIIDQYRVKTDPRSGITNDPNNPEDEQYIVRLLKKIVTVSLETVKIVNNLPEEFE